VAVTVKVYCPAVVGISLKVPAEDSVNPGGKAPAVTVSEAYGPVWPGRTRAWE